MHLTVVTAVLLSVGILNAVTAQSHSFIAQFVCAELEDVPCGDGWSRIDNQHCFKFFQTPKSFDDAQKHCVSLGSELASIPTQRKMWKAICITRRANPKSKPVWIGVKRSGEGFTNTDGSDVEFTQWYPGQPDNVGGQENCVEMNHKDWGYWNDDNCADKNAFMCSKKNKR